MEQRKKTKGDIKNYLCERFKQRNIPLSLYIYNPLESLFLFERAFEFRAVIEQRLNRFNRFLQSSSILRTNESSDWELSMEIFWSSEGKASYFFIIRRELKFCSLIRSRSRNFRERRLIGFEGCSLVRVWRLILKSQWGDCGWCIMDPMIGGAAVI